ncbi:MAG: hypothetical protein EOP48_07685 [Sphingobacteriales bacterium]|nr:MAG: hypothetical protein EOP48_07685 [Sphingobacteriales bacterium]
METFNIPKYSTVIYRLNPETRYFAQTLVEVAETPITRLPAEMRQAPAKAGNIIPNASLLMLSRKCNKGNYKFITGLQQTLRPDWYVGNDYEYYRGKKVLSLILFQFRDEGREVAVHYFHRYDKHTSIARLQFANNVIPLIAKEGYEP